jgi:RNA polymerase-binding transcription factor
VVARAQIAGGRWRETPRTASTGVDAPRPPGASVLCVDPQRAQELLAGERARIERELAALERDGRLEAAGRKEPGDEGSESLYEDEVEETRREQLDAELAAVERAEARLAAGTYGLSVQSGKPIPDERLEALPTAERTVEEDEPFTRN